jgi:hypothetical protein
MKSNSDATPFFAIAARKAGRADAFVRGPDGPVRRGPRSPGKPLGTPLAFPEGVNAKVNPLIEEARSPVAVDPQLRRRFWARLSRLGILRPQQLIGIHQMAQKERIAPEEAVVALGMLTKAQALEFLEGESPFGFFMEGLGIS